MHEPTEPLSERLTLPQVPGTDAAADALNAPLRRIAVVTGDLSDPDPAWGLDTVVNAANESLLGGGGVDGAIHAAAGPELLAFNRTLGGCATGLAKLSPAFGLEAAGVRRILHTVGPVWSGVADTGVPGAPGDETAKLGYTLEDTQLAGCYASCLRLAEETEAAAVGFPAISTGAYGFPPERAARIAFGHVFGHFSRRPAPVFPGHVVFVCFDEEDAEVYRDVIETRAEWMLGRARA